jgi:MFS transporter, ACS family, glucarate transporter
MIQRSTTMRPTRTRYWVVAFSVTLAVITYIDRVCISQTAPAISRELGLSDVQMGYVFGAFALSYALFEIPGGILGDWIGPRKVLMRIVIWWSFFTAATGWAWDYVTLWLTRLFFGAGEAGCFPNVTKAFTIWLTKEERVRAQGIMWMSARWGGAFTPLLVVFVLDYMSWRGAFELFGAIGVVWAVFFYLWFRDRPQEKASVNAAELQLLKDAESMSYRRFPWREFWRGSARWCTALGPLIVMLFQSFPLQRPLPLWFFAAALAWAVIVLLLSRGKPAPPPEAALPGSDHSHIPWKTFLRSRSVWLLWIQYFCLAYGWYFYITWLPTYLQKARGLSFSRGAVFAILPLFLGGLGSLFCGFISGPVTGWTGSVLKTRRLMACLGFTGATGFLILSTFLRDPLWAMLSIGMASFSNDLVMPGSWGACMDVGGRYAGTLSGAMNMMGNFGGVVSPVAIGYILQSTGGNWDITFYVSAAVYFMGVFCWLFLDPVTPLEKESLQVEVHP